VKVSSAKPSPLPPVRQSVPAKNGSIKLGAVRSIFRLVGEVRELGADAAQWRPHLVSELRRLLGAEVVTSSEVHLRRQRDGSVTLLDAGWGTDGSDMIWVIRTEQRPAQPETFLLSLGQLAESAAVDQSDAGIPVKPLQPLYAGRSFILSQYPLADIWAVDQLGIHRAADRDPFTPSDHRLVRLLHVELGRLWKRDILRQARDPESKLPPRLKQTLDALVAGHSEKEIAAKLALSRHTIHNYVKALHHRFGVSSRGELLARVSQQRQHSDFTPKMSIPPQA
jgi:DNA-binding CsgD family transcriptional regulator